MEEEARAQDVVSDGDGDDDGYDDGNDDGDDDDGDAVERLGLSELPSRIVI